MTLPATITTKEMLVPDFWRGKGIFKPASRNLRSLLRAHGEVQTEGDQIFTIVGSNRVPLNQEKAEGAADGIPRPSSATAAPEAQGEEAHA